MSFLANINVEVHVTLPRRFRLPFVSTTMSCNHRSNRDLVTTWPTVHEHSAVDSVVAAVEMALDQLKHMLTSMTTKPQLEVT